MCYTILTQTNKVQGDARHAFIHVKSLLRVQISISFYKSQNLGRAYIRCKLSAKESAIAVNFYSLFAF